MSATTDLVGRAPKRALVDALRNCSVGPSNLSQQDIGYLRQLARETLRSNKAGSFAENLAIEVEYQRSRRAGRATEGAND